MASTSETPKQYDPFEQVTPFFNRAQIYAFQQAPSPEAMRKVNRGGSHDYIPHEYIRALLDRFIGPGRWEMKAVVHSVDKEIVKKGGKDQVAATAIVNVELAILAKDDPETRLTYAGVGSHTMYAAVEQGFGSVIGNAIDSAESDGVKAAAKNLGKAFGFDLKGKLNRDALPPSIAAYGQMLTERFGRAAPQAALPAPDGEQQDETDHADDAPNAAPAIQEERREAREPQGRRQEDEPRRQQRAERAEDERGTDASVPRHDATPRREEAPRERGDRQRSESAPVDRSREDNRQDREQRERQQDREASREQQRQDAPAAEQQQGAQDGGQGDQKAAPRVWELSMDPGTNYDDWIACLQTMASRIAAMTSTREIESFVKRYAKRIKDLPQIPADEKEGRPAKDFKARFRRIVAKKYQDLGADVPEQFAEKAAVNA